MFISQAGFSHPLVADAIPAHVDVIITTFFPAFSYPKTVRCSVARPLCAPTILGPDLDIHRLHKIDDFAYLRNLTSALLERSRLKLKGARLSDQIESLHFFFEVTSDCGAR
jgi:hypothetical protein